MNIETNRRINELVAEIKTIEQRISEAGQAKQICSVKLGELLKQLPIQGVIELIPQDARPTLVPVEKPGRPLVMMIPKQAPDFGILVWADQWYPGSTGAFLTFKNSALEHDPCFYLPCGCCCFNSDEAIQPLKKETLRPLYITLHETIAQVSREQGVHHIFVRRPEAWEALGKIPGLLMVEGNGLHSSITKWYGETAARSFFSYWRGR